MKTHLFDLENQYFPASDNALLPLDNISQGDDITIDIWSSVGESAVIDLKDADTTEVIINKFEIQVPNAISIKFLAKKFAIKIKELIFKCGGINYQGGAEVENLSIFTCRPEVSISSDSIHNILIQAVSSEDEEPIRQLLSSIEMIPGCGEYVYDPDSSNAKRSLTELKTALPNIKWVAPVVAWFANSLDVDKCQIKPGIDRNYKNLYGWQVDKYTEDSAYIVSVDEKNNSVYGGTINDESIIKYLQLLKENDLNIIFYPLIMVDTPGKPWRGRIGATNQDQDRVADHIEQFFQAQYRPFIIHYAYLVKDKVDAFIIGSELIGLTSLYDKNKKFPFIQKLMELSSEVKQILSQHVKITYAADWSEYHSTAGGLRPLDDLWASSSIDFIGIDAYFPITDSLSSRISSEEIKQGWQSGEGYDYYYSGSDKISFESKYHAQWKNLSHWWSSQHWAWDEVNQKSIETPWLPKSKPIWFTEFGFPSIDKAPNKPNVFYDPKSSEGNIPSRSSGRVDYAIQLRTIRASLEYWQNSEFIEQMILWTWDARGQGWQNNREYYADGDLWAYGHWLDSKIAYRHLELSGDIKKAKNLILTADSLYLAANLEAEKIFAEVKSNIGLNNRICIGESAFFKCDNISIAGNISGKALLAEAVQTSLNANIDSLELLSIDGETLNIGQIDLRVAQIITNLSHNLNIAAPEITSSINESDDGGKTRTVIENQTITPKHTISAMQAEFNVGGTFNIPPIEIDIEELFITAGELSLQVMTTDHKRTVFFTGGKDWKGDRQKWTQVTFVQTAYVVEINTGSLFIEVEGTFSGIASKIKANTLSMEAKDLAFQGQHLESYVTKDGHSKREIFKPQKNYHGESRHTSIEGVTVIVAGTAYMISHGQIWLQASGISANQLIVKAPKILLEGVVSSDYHSMNVSKKGVKLSLTCNTREISGGVEAYRQNYSMQQYSEHLVPSILQGRESLEIEADNIHQHGSILSGRVGKIKASSWTSSAPTLTQSYSESRERIQLLALGKTLALL